MNARADLKPPIFARQAQVRLGPGVHLHDGQVIHHLEVQHPQRQRAAIGQHGLQPIAAGAAKDRGHHVVVGDRAPLRVNEEAAARTYELPSVLAQRAHADHRWPHPYEQGSGGVAGSRGTARRGRRCQCGLRRQSAGGKA